VVRATDTPTSTPAGNTHTTDESDDQAVLPHPTSRCLLANCQGARASADEHVRGKRRLAALLGFRV
jgi:hypothetical protein